MKKTESIARDVAFGLAGLALLSAAAIHGLSVHRFVQTSEVASGQVVATPNGGSHPEIRFRLAAAPSVPVAPRDITYSQSGMGIVGYSVGDLVRVRYDPGAPSRGPCLDTWAALWGTTVFLALLAQPFVWLPIGRRWRGRATRTTP